jgi:hypothetical protein
MTIEINNDDTPESIKKKVQQMEDHQRDLRVERFKKYFGILKLKVDPLELQKKWRDEWE